VDSAILRAHVMPAIADIIIKRPPADVWSVITDAAAHPSGLDAIALRYIKATVNWSRA